MCGLAGFISLQDSPINKKRLENSLHHLKNRGPNGQRIEIYNSVKTEVGLGHTRLSVLDLRSTASQPMSSFDDNFTIVFNGEIYNYLELRSDLEKLNFIFKTNGDTEVLLNAWIAWGEDALVRLNGMFSFAVLDRKKKKLTLVRDHFGIKPMYYTKIDKTFYFASTLPALNALTGRQLNPCMNSGLNYVINGIYDSGETTFFKEAKQLLPASLLNIDLDTLNQSSQIKWWDPSCKLKYNISFKDAAEIIRKKFIQNVKLNLRSDVKYGAALSGGIDSSAIVAAMRHDDIKSDIFSFSYISENKDISEENWIDLVSKNKNTDSTKIFIQENDLITKLDDLIIAQGEPFASSGVFAQYEVYKEVQECGVTVILDGQGADEIFCGYHGYPIPRIRSLLSKFNFIKAFIFINNWRKNSQRSLPVLLKELFSSYLPRPFKSLLKNMLNRHNKSSRAPYKFINKSYLGKINTLNNYSYKNNNYISPKRQLVGALKNALLGDGLAKLLRHGDRNSMRWSVESRVPFLNPDLVEFVLGLPEEHLISSDAVTKHVFREAMKGLVPDQILNRQDKIGFEPPEKSWLIENSTAVAQVLSYAHNIPIFDHDTASSVMQDLNIEGSGFDSRLVWRVMNYVRWFELNANGKI